MSLKPYTTGFRLDGQAKDPISMPLAIVSVAKGDIMKDDGAGYLTNASITTFTAETAWYVAMEPVDNSGGALGDLSILCLLANDMTNRWVVPVEDQNVLLQTDVGTIVDLQSEDGIDADTAVTDTGIGFLIEEIDISTDSIAANTYGYAKGRFLVLGETT